MTEAVDTHPTQVLSNGQLRDSSTTGYALCRQPESPDRVGEHARLRTARSTPAVSAPATAGATKHADAPSATSVDRGADNPTHSEAVHQCRTKLVLR